MKQQNLKMFAAMYIGVNTIDCPEDSPLGKARHNSRIESWLGCMLGALRVVLHVCTKKLHFVSWNWRMEN